MTASRRPPRTSGTIAPGVVHPHRRMRLLLVGVLLVLSLFAAQLVRLQGLEAATVSAAALDGRLQAKIVPAQRGAITDRNGAELAVSVERRQIVADPTLTQDYVRRDDDGEVVGEGFAAAAEVVAEVTGAERSAVLAKLENPDSVQWTVLVPDVSVQVWNELRARGVRGVSAEEHLRRDYPLGEAVAPLVGKLGAGEEPAGGIELVYDEMLTGTPGELVYEAGRDGEIITTGFYSETAAEPGRDVRLSIDADLQWYAYDAVRTRVEESGGHSGYAVVQEVRTGRVLALASYPSFDPTEPATVEEMRNAAVEDVYEPGSTAKLLTAAAALEEGLVERDTPIEVPSRLPRGGHSFRDVTPHGTLYLTFAGVLAQSSNMGTILYGELLGNEKLAEWLTRFGMGSTTGFGLPGESAGLVPALEDWSATTPYTMMFGQGLSSTLLQQVAVFQTVANDGIRIAPSLIAGTVDEEGRYVEEPAPAGQRVVSQETADTLIEIMEQIPSSGGTAPLAAIDGYHVAGKTSTATRVDPQTGRYTGGVTASFIGFAPADDPQYLVAVTVQRPTRISEYGGIIAAPVFADIMRYTLQRNAVPPATEPQLVLDLEYDPEDPAPGQPAGVTLSDVAIRDERNSR